jgi:hypothetical protein
MKNYKLIAMMICVVLLTSGVLYGQEKEISFDNNKVLSLLPKGTGFVLMIDMKRIIDSSLYKQIAEKEEIQQKYKAYKESSGIDLQKDVDRIVFFMAEESDESHNCSIFIFIGRLDKDKIISAKTNSSISIKEEIYRNEKIYFFVPKLGLYNNGWVFMNGLIAIGDFTKVEIEYLKRFIDSYYGEGGNIKNNQGFINLIKEANQADMVWGAGFWPEFYKEEAAGSPYGNGFATIDSIILSANIDKELEFSVKFKCTNEEGAKNLDDAIKGIIDREKMTSAENQEILGFLNETGVELNGEAVTILFRISVDSMLWIVKWLEELLAQIYLS